MSSIDEVFSRTLKIQKSNYISGDYIDFSLIDSQLGQLSQFSLDQLTNDDLKKSFWINVYNGLTNYWIIKKGIKKKMKEDPRIFLFYKTNIGGYEFSLDNIEHGILRRNKKVKYWPLPQFLFWDKRRELICHRLDYRVHFALNCGANSCPALAFYSSKDIDKQLTDAESIFTEADFEVDEESKYITASKIFDWYRNDFVNVYLNNPKYKGFSIVLKEYDWSIG